MGFCFEVCFAHWRGHCGLLGLPEIEQLKLEKYEVLRAWQTPASDSLRLTWGWTALTCQLLNCRGSNGDQKCLSGLLANCMILVSPPQFYWDMTDIYHCVSLRWTTQWSDICTCCKIITTGSQHPPPHSYPFFCVWWKLVGYTLLATVKYTTRYLLWSPCCTLHPQDWLTL